MNLPDITAKYFKDEFEHAYENGGWDGRAYLKWNNHLNELAREGELYLDDDGNPVVPTPEPSDNDYRNL